MISLMSLFNADNYRTYSLHVAKTLGSVNASIVLAELIQRYEYHKKENQLISLRKQEGEWFYFTSDKCEERTALSREEQDTAINLLIRKGLVNKVIAGLPGKRHFQLNQLIIYEILINSKNVSSLCDSHKLDCGNHTNCIEGIPQSTKETKKELLSKRTTTSPKKSSSSFSINRNLGKLEELPLDERQKNQIYKHFDDPTIMQAIEVYRSRKSEPDDLGAFLYSACKGGFKKSISKEEVFESNRAFTKNLLGKFDDMNFYNGYRVLILAKYVEFSSNTNAVCLNYEDADFRNKLKGWAHKFDPCILIV